MWKAFVRHSKLKGERVFHLDSWTKVGISLLLLTPEDKSSHLHKVSLRKRCQGGYPHAYLVSRPLSTVLKSTLWFNYDPPKSTWYFYTRIEAKSLEWHCQKCSLKKSLMIKFSFFNWYCLKCLVVFLFCFCFCFYCSGFCHTLKWISHGFTCVPHPDPPSHLPLHLLPLGLPSVPGPSACLMHSIWAGDLFHPR